MMWWSSLQAAGSTQTLLMKRFRHEPEVVKTMTIWPTSISKNGGSNF